MAFSIILILVVLVFLYIKKRDNGSPKKENFNKRNKIKEEPITKIKNIFEKYNPVNLGESDLEKAIKNYNHSIYYIYKGKLESSTEYALLIGTSDEWVNLITLTRAQKPTYETYGFSVIQNRWSYGSKVLGAKEFRQFIKKNISEIKMLMTELTPIRIEKEKEKRLKIAEEEKEQKTYEEERKKEEAELKKAQKYFSKKINKNFKTVYFEYNQNKTKLESAIKEANNHYYDIDIINQTCSCPEYISENYKYDMNDVRRLCTHLNRIITQHKILKKSKDKLDQFILENLKYGILGVYKRKIGNNLDFAIILYNWSKNISVVTPKTNKDGFIMVEWKIEDNNWNPNRGGKKINEQIRVFIEKQFDI